MLSLLLHNTVVGKAVIHSGNVWDKAVSARWKPGDIHFGFGCEFLVLPYHLP